MYHLSGPAGVPVCLLKKPKLNTSVWEYLDLPVQTESPVFKTFEMCCSVDFLYRAKPRRIPKKAEEQYDEDDPEAYKDAEVPDKVGGFGHPATPVLLSFLTLM